jgi:hypothetical protein
VRGKRHLHTCIAGRKDNLRRSILKKDNPKRPIKIFVHRINFNDFKKLGNSVKKLGTSVKKLGKSVRELGKSVRKLGESVRKLGKSVSN